MNIENGCADTPHILDCIGLRCPEPVMLLHTKVREVEEGAVIKVMATDPSTQWDIPKFCQFLGHNLLRRETVDNVMQYWIEVRAQSE